MYSGRVLYKFWVAAEFQEKLNDWEMDVSHLSYLLCPFTLEDNKLDSLIWTTIEDTSFSVKSSYTLLQKQLGHWDFTWP